MDAGLAKLMNSSVGTSALKALDTILKTDNTTIANNAADRLINSLKNSTKLVGSDEVLFSYEGQWTPTDEITGCANGYKSSSFIKFDTSGTVTIKTLQTGGRSNNKEEYRIKAIDSSGNQIKFVSAELDYGATGYIELELNVTAGSKYKFVVANGNYSVVEPNLLVCGKTIMFAPAITLTT